ASGLPPPAGYGPGCGTGPEPVAVPFNLPLHNGDLLLMDAPTQLWWQHAVPRRLRLQQERFNLTFRLVRSGRV
ncbi:MAG: alpha-ketoglutarate-dependent dioxygenase AlkB, partial [Cyanobium sp.]